MIKGAEYNSNGGKLRFVGIFSIEDENLWCDLITVLKYMRLCTNKMLGRYFHAHIKEMGLKKIRKMFLKWLSREVLSFKFFGNSFSYVM